MPLGMRCGHRRRWLTSTWPGSDRRRRRPAGGTEASGCAWAGVIKIVRWVMQGVHTMRCKEDVLVRACSVLTCRS